MDCPFDVAGGSRCRILGATKRRNLTRRSRIDLDVGRKTASAKPGAWPHGIDRQDGRVSGPPVTRRLAGDLITGHRAQNRRNDAGGLGVRGSTFKGRQNSG